LRDALDVASTRGLMRFFSRWPLILAFAVVTVVLSLMGYYGPGAKTPHPGLIDWITSTMGIFKLGIWIPSTPWPLEVARYTGAVFTFAALAKAWASVCREQIHRFRLSRWSGHVVVCGMGRKGFRLAQEFRRLGRRVVIADASPKGDDIPECRRAGILISVGDVMNESTLEMVRVEHARYVIAMCGDDHTNIEVAMETLARYSKLRSPGRLTCYVHLLNLPLRVLLQRNELLRERPPEFDLQLVNIFENTARALFAGHPFGDPASARGRRVHVVVVGLTSLGEAVITQVARVAHYADLRAAKVTVVDEKAEARGEDFLARQPGIGETCELRLCPMRLTDPRFARLEFLGEPADDEERTIVLCLDDDEENVRLALRLTEQTKAGRVTILARVGERRGLAKLLAASPGELACKRISFFGAIEDVCSWDILRNQHLDMIAKALHTHYKAAHGRIPEWDGLTEDLRNSNRAAADHIEIKLRAIGCNQVGKAELADGAPKFEFMRDEIELLAQMEHRRWCADRWLSGWTLGDKKDFDRKLHPNLVPWEQLTEEDREKDREQVCSLPEVLDGAGLAILRKSCGS
jgi:voltage-gated potassium channel Kch